MMNDIVGGILGLDGLRQATIPAAVYAMRATPADIPGLWDVPGYAELTTNQLVQLAMTNTPLRF